MKYYFTSPSFSVVHHISPNPKLIFFNYSVSFFRVVTSRIFRRIYVPDFLLVRRAPFIRTVDSIFVKRIALGQAFHFGKFK